MRAVSLEDGEGVLSTEVPHFLHSDLIKSIDDVLHTYWYPVSHMLQYQSISFLLQLRDNFLSLHHTISSFFRYQQHRWSMKSSLIIYQLYAYTMCKQHILDIIERAILSYAMLPLLIEKERQKSISTIIPSVDAYVLSSDDYVAESDYVRLLQDLKMKLLMKMRRSINSTAISHEVKVLISHMDNMQKSIKLSLMNTEGFSAKLSRDMADIVKVSMNQIDSISKNQITVLRRHYITSKILRTISELPTHDAFRSQKPSLLGDIFLNCWNFYDLSIIMSISDRLDDKDVNINTHDSSDYHMILQRKYSIVLMKSFQSVNCIYESLYHHITNTFHTASNTLRPDVELLHIARDALKWCCEGILLRKHLIRCARRGLPQQSSNDADVLWLFEYLVMIDQHSQLVKRHIGQSNSDLYSQLLSFSMKAIELNRELRADSQCDRQRHDRCQNQCLTSYLYCGPIIGHYESLSHSSQSSHRMIKLKDGLSQLLCNAIKCLLLSRHVVRANPQKHRTLITDEALAMFNKAIAIAIQSSHTTSTSSELSIHELVGSIYALIIDRQRTWVKNPIDGVIGDELMKDDDKLAKCMMEHYHAYISSSLSTTIPTEIIVFTKKLHMLRLLVVYVGLLATHSNRSTMDVCYLDLYLHTSQCLNALEIVSPILLTGIFRHDEEMIVMSQMTLFQLLQEYLYWLEIALTIAAIKLETERYCDNDRLKIIMNDFILSEDWQSIVFGECLRYDLDKQYHLLFEAMGGKLLGLFDISPPRGVTRIKAWWRTIMQTTINNHQATTLNALMSFKQGVHDIMIHMIDEWNSVCRNAVQRDNILKDSIEDNHDSSDDGCKMFFIHFTDVLQYSSGLL